MENNTSTTSEIIETNKILSFNTIFLLIIILVLFLTLFYNDRENIQIKDYLKKIYINSKSLKEEHSNLINNNLKKIFINDKMILIEDFLTENFYTYLKNQFIDKKFKSLNYYVRKGNGINFANLHKTEEYKGFLELYYSNEIQRVLSDILEKNVQRPPLSDNNSCSILIYSNPEDYIDWHKDYSNYYGDRYVILLSLINNNQNKECCSENEFMYIEKDNNIGKLKLKPNSLLIFKGSEILHKSTSISFGEQRILFSMTFCDICQEKKNIAYNIYETIKNGMLYENFNKK